MSLYRRIIIPLTVFGSLLMMSTGSYGLPFSITPVAGTFLPTKVIPGQTTTAFYTVANNTKSTRIGNFVKYLPPNVTQVTTDTVFSDLCGASFTLMPQGTAESSCTLELRISGGVSAHDPDPHHHLFVCFPGGMSCAGTPYPLNVSATAPTSFTRAYVANLTTQNISLCSIVSGTNQFVDCQNSASVFDGPASMAFNSSKTRMYVANFAGGAGTTVSMCTVDSITGTLSACANADGDGSAVFSAPLGLSINASGTFAYIANIGNNTVSSCTIDAITGKLTQCIANSNGFNAPIYWLPLKGDGSRAYVSNTGAAQIFLCSVNLATGTLSNCSNADEDGTAVFSGPALMSLNLANTRLYVSDNAGGVGTSVSLCSVNLVTGKLYNCQDSGVGPIFSAPVAVTLNADNTVLYVSNELGTTVSLCQINPLTGLLTSCADSAGDGSAVFTQPAGVALT